MLDLWKYLIGENTIGYCEFVTLNFPSTTFSGLDRLMYDFIEYCTKLSVAPTKMSMDYYIQTDMKKFLIRTNLYVPGTEGMSYNDPNSVSTIVETTKQVLLSAFGELEYTPSTENEFSLVMKKFMDDQLSASIIESAQTLYRDISTTDDKQAAASKHLDRMLLLQSTYDPSILESISPKPKDEDLRPVGRYGIEVVDRDVGELLTTRLYGVEAAPGIGKTRLQIQMVHITATEYKSNCLIIALEQSASEIISMLVARHCWLLYGEIIDDNAARQHKLPPDLESKVAAAQIDLFESGKYGKIVVLDKGNVGDFTVDNFIPKLRMYNHLHGPFDLISIDYMSLIDPTREIREDYHLIRYAYRRFKRFLLVNGIAGIAVQQLNVKGIEATLNDKDITPDMAQGGIEVYRSPDYNVAIACTQLQKQREQVRVCLPKVRNSRGFPTTLINVKQGACIYQ